MKASREEDAPSPCIGVCAINPQTGYCEGCFRTLDEIAGWSSYSVEQKRAVLARTQERRKPMRGGDMLGKKDLDDLPAGL